MHDLRHRSQVGFSFLEFGPTPSLPAFVINVLQMAAREMDQSLGIAAFSEAVRKKQAPSGQTLEQVKEIQQTPIRLKGRKIEVFLRSLGRKNIFTVFQFYGLIPVDAGDGGRARRQQSAGPV